MSSLPPPNFPANIPISLQTFVNWDLTIQAPNLWTCTPQSPADVVTVCNWAKDNGYKVRARGIMHTWSPLTVAAGTPPEAKVLLVDLTQKLNQMKLIPASGGGSARVEVGVGATMDQLMSFLEVQAGGAGPAPGYSFPHIPAPGHLTVGGVLAINAHGTAVATPPLDDFNASFGSLSNQILELTAVVTDPDSPTPDVYTLRTFKRGDADARALLTHLGRAFLVEATLQVVDNYNLRCQSITDLTADVLFQPVTESEIVPVNSLAHFLKQSGRVEVIWFPFSQNPWLKVWSVAPQQPAGSRAVASPYNYPFSDNLPEEVTTLLKQITSGAFAFLTPAFGQLMAKFTSFALDGFSLLGVQIYPRSRDLWGPSKNTMIYIKDTTLRVTADGYAVQMKKADVQQAVHDFTTKFSQMLEDYQRFEYPPLKKPQWPINSPLEIRVTNLDDPAKVAVGPGATAESPVISSLSRDEVAVKNGWDVALWLDVLTLPGTPASNQFYRELEEWIHRRFTGAAGRVMPEWSKGWAYTAEQGPWTNGPALEAIRQGYTTGRDQTNDWAYEVATLKKFDRHNLFSNPLLERLFVAP